MRQIILDTETTGLDPQAQGHKIIEVAAVEIDRSSGYGTARSRSTSTPIAKSTPVRRKCMA